MISRFDQNVSGSVTVVVGGSANESKFGTISADGGNTGAIVGTTSGGPGGSGGGASDDGYGYQQTGGSNGGNGANSLAGPAKIGGAGQGTGSTTNNPSPCSGTTGIDGVTRCGGGGGSAYSRGLKAVARLVGLENQLPISVAQAPMITGAAVAAEATPAVAAQAE